MVAGPPSTMHQSAHGRPNAAKRSARGRWKALLIKEEVLRRKLSFALRRIQAGSSLVTINYRRAARAQQR